MTSLEWLNTPVSQRLRAIIFTPNAPVSKRWKALVVSQHPGCSSHTRVLIDWTSAHHLRSGSLRLYMDRIYNSPGSSARAQTTISVGRASHELNRSPRSLSGFISSTVPFSSSVGFSFTRISIHSIPFPDRLTLIIYHSSLLHVRYTHFSHTFPQASSYIFVSSSFALHATYPVVGYILRTRSRLCFALLTVSRLLHLVHHVILYCI